MALPYYLTHKIQEKGTYLRKTASHFTDFNITIIQARVDHINYPQQSLTLNNGDKTHYNKLLIATGSIPISPPIPGINLPNIFPCWTLDNARQIAEHGQIAARNMAGLSDALHQGNINMNVLPWD